MAKRRRELLTAAASVVGSALAGCMDGDSGNGGDNQSNQSVTGEYVDREIPPTVEATFPQFQYDAANTGAVPDVSGPTGAIRSLFEFGTIGSARRLGTPAVADGTMYVTGAAGAETTTVTAPDTTGTETGTLGADETAGTVVSAVDAVSGSVQWERRYAATGDPGPTAVVDDTVVAPVGGAIVALDAVTGDQQWRYDCGVASGSAVADGTVYVVGTQDGTTLYALSAADGALAWASDIDAETNYTTPAVADGTVYVGGTTLQAFDTADGSERWRVERGVSTAPVVAEGSVVVAGDGALGAYDTDGVEQWTVELGEEDDSVPVSHPPAVADGRLYLSLAGELRVYDLELGETFYTVAIGIDGTPVVADDYVYLLGSGQATCLAAHDGATEWSYGTQQQTVSAGVAPAVVDGVAYFPAERVYAIAE
jgi:outer membrane protein assembly factor BamB